MMLGEGTLGMLQLAEQNGAGLAQARHDGRVVVRPGVASDRHAIRRRDAFCEDIVLDRDRHAVERSARAAGADLLLCLLGLVQGEFGGHQSVGLERRVERGDPVQHRPRRFDGRDRAAANASAELRRVKKMNLRGHGVSSRGIKVDRLHRDVAALGLADDAASGQDQHPIRQLRQELDILLDQRTIEDAAFETLMSKRILAISSIMEG